MADGSGLPVPDNQIGPTLYNRFHKRRHVATKVLVVSIGVDDDVGPQFQTSVEARFKRVPQSPISRKTYDVVDAGVTSHPLRIVRGAVVDDQDLYLIDALDGSRNILYRIGEGVFFVQAGDLYDQFHGCRPVRVLPVLFNMVLSRGS